MITPEIQSRTKHLANIYALWVDRRSNDPLVVKSSVNLYAIDSSSTTKSIWYTSYNGNNKYPTLFVPIKRSFQKEGTKKICKWPVSLNHFECRWRNLFIKPINTYEFCEWPTNGENLTELNAGNCISNQKQNLAFGIPFVVIWVIISRKLKCLREEKLRSRAVVT